MGHLMVLQVLQLPQDAPFIKAFHEVGFGFCLGEEGSWEGGGSNMASFFPEYYYNIEMCP